MKKKIKEFEMLGIKFKTYEGSERHLLYTYLEKKGWRTFSTVGIAKAMRMRTSNLSSILNREYRKGNISRTKRLIYLPDEQNAAHIYTLEKDNEIEEYEAYMYAKLKNHPGVREAYEKIREGGVHSSVDLHLEYELLDDFKYLLSFRQLKLIWSIKSPVGWFYYNPQRVSDEEAAAKMTASLDEASANRQKKIDKGYFLEDNINKFLEEHYEKVIWKCTRYKKQVMKQIGHKKRFFDFVLYFRPYLQTESGDVPLKYFSRSFVVPVEVKASRGSKMVSGNVINLHVLESREIWNSVYPVVIGDPTDTGIKALEEFTAGLITLKDTKKLSELV